PVRAVFALELGDALGDDVELPDDEEHLRPPRCHADETRPVPAFQPAVRHRMVKSLRRQGPDKNDWGGPRKSMQDFEKLGLFYLGKTYDVGLRRATPNLLLYESKDLTTHAVCVGMTGSGKTGLGIALLEEAAIDGIPVLAIDPKGDLGNLLLGFPEL